LSLVCLKVYVAKSVTQTRLTVSQNTEASFHDFITQQSMHMVYSYNMAG